MIRHWTKSTEANTADKRGVWRRWMERKWLDYVFCITMPHIALLIGLAFLAFGETPEHNKFGLRIIRLSIVVMLIGLLAYYVFFTPFFGLD